MLVPQNLRVGQIVDCTEAEGPGKRFAIWTQGCPILCPGCCNPEFLPESGGTMMAIEDIVQRIIKASLDSQVEGVTFLGGEPLAQLPAVAEVAARVKMHGLSVMVFTGYTIEEIQGMLRPAAQQLLWLTDILVDGPYLQAKPESKRRWIGSTNQRIHFLTNRYSAKDPQWQQANTLEIRLTNDELIVNGFPAAESKALWRRPKPLDS